MNTAEPNIREKALAHWMTAGNSSYKNPFLESVGALFMAPVGINYSYFSYDAFGAAAGVPDEITFVMPQFNLKAFAANPAVARIADVLVAQSAKVGVTIHDPFIVVFHRLPGVDLLDTTADELNGEVAHKLNTLITEAVFATKIFLDLCMDALLHGDESLAVAFLHSQESFIDAVYKSTNEPEVEPGKTNN